MHLIPFLVNEKRYRGLCVEHQATKQRKHNIIKKKNKRKTSIKIAFNSHTTTK